MEMFISEGKSQECQQIFLFLQQQQQQQQQLELVSIFRVGDPIIRGS
jgi:hypothetical protein